MRKKTMLATAMALLVLMLAVSPAAAVTDGELDGNGHPYQYRDQHSLTSQRYAKRDKYCHANQHDWSVSNAYVD